jgi:hypothetical protein
MLPYRYGRACPGHNVAGQALAKFQHCERMSLERPAPNAISGRDA